MIKPYEPETDYEVFCYLSSLHKWPIISESLLSPTGFVSYLGDTPGCFVFVYETVGSAWAIMEWLMVNPTFEKKDREIAINECIDAACSFARSKNLTLFTSCKGDKLKQRYLAAGLIKTDEGMTNFTYRG